jgi:hypothetical protein
MAIVLFLGGDVKEYVEKSTGMIGGYLGGGRIRCDCCAKPMRRHSVYGRKIKETGEKIDITVVYCKACNNWHALLPDFILPFKQYSANEVEGVIIDSQTLPPIEIDTAASEATVRRWIAGVGGKLVNAVSILKSLFIKKGKTISEIMITPGHAYDELEQVLFMAPEQAESSGNKLGLANIWLGTDSPPVLI